MIDPQRLLDLKFPEIRRTFTGCDTILYALGAGIGCDPLDPTHLRFVYERSAVALPTMATTLAYPGDWYWDFDTGLDHQHIVHASELIMIHTALPVEGTALAKAQVLDVIDKGKGKVVLVVSERAMCRGDGGFPPAPRKSEPQTQPPNPLPILRGLATMGVVCHAAVRLAFGGWPERLRWMDCRFTAPVYPGEAISSQFWRVEEQWLFRAQVSDRVVAVGAVGKSIDGV